MLITKYAKKICNHIKANIDLVWYIWQGADFEERKKLGPGLSISRTVTCVRFFFITSLSLASTVSQDSLCGYHYRNLNGIIWFYFDITDILE